MKYLSFLVALFLYLPLSAAPYSADVEKLLGRLDSLIASKDAFIEAKEQKIEQLRMQAAHTHTEEERYWMNKMF